MEGAGTEAMPVRSEWPVASFVHFTQISAEWFYHRLSVTDGAGLSNVELMEETPSAIASSIVSLQLRNLRQWLLF